ncbi:MAG: hypothetical protein L0Y39_03290 [Methylococcaceae bacterium]|nr:hypothetical protein [Methylococcaceae bacterium]
MWAEAEWKAVYIVSKQQSPPDTPPVLNEMIGMIAAFGGFLSRAPDGLPGPQTIWIGLQRTKNFDLAIESFHNTWQSGCG